MSTTLSSLNVTTMVFLPPPHLTYFTFADNAVILCFHTVAVSFYTHILYCYHFKQNKLKTSNLARSLLIFIWTHLICAVSDMPYHAYLVVKWNPANLENYDPYVLYWTGISVGIYYNLTSLSVLLLSLDRLLVLRFFYHYKNKNIERWLPRITILFLLGCSVYTTVNYLMVLPLDMDNLKHCQSQACVAAVSYVFDLRIWSIIINLLISAYFLWTFRSVNKKEKTTIRIIMMTIALEIVFNAFPYLMVILLMKVAEFNLIGNAGSILTVLITANIAFSAAYTWFILVRRNKIAVIAVVSTNQINPRIMSKI